MIFSAGNFEGCYVQLTVPIMIIISASGHSFNYFAVVFQYESVKNSAYFNPGIENPIQAV